MQLKTITIPKDYFNKEGVPDLERYNALFIKELNALEQNNRIFNIRSIHDQGTSAARIIEYKKAPDDRKGGEVDISLIKVCDEHLDENGRPDMDLYNKYFEEEFQKLQKSRGCLQVITDMVSGTIYARSVVHYLYSGSQMMIKFKTVEFEPWMYAEDGSPKLDEYNKHFGNVTAEIEKEHDILNVFSDTFKGTTFCRTIMYCRKQN